jgi:hypothetical protein
MNIRKIFYEKFLWRLVSFVFQKVFDKDPSLDYYCLKVFEEKMGVHKKIS